MEKPIIRIRGLKKNFTLTPGMFSGKRTIVRAVDDVTLDINEGEIVGLIGESGSGKTTLARVLLGLSQSSGGTAEIDGQDITKADKKTLRAIRSKYVTVSMYVLAINKIDCHSMFLLNDWHLRAIITKYIPQQRRYPDRDHGLAVKDDGWIIRKNPYFLP